MGKLRLADLSTRQLKAIFEEFAATPGPTGRLRSAATVKRVHATLHAALNAARREGLIQANPARGVELPSVRKPYGVVWTDQVIAQWHKRRPATPVAVWTTELLADFLAHVTTDRLYALWWLIALRGLRRGEAVGLRWNALDLKKRVLYVVTQRTTVGYQVIEHSPKSRKSLRAVALEPAHRRRPQSPSGTPAARIRQRGPGLGPGRVRVREHAAGTLASEQRHQTVRLPGQGSRAAAGAAA